MRARGAIVLCVCALSCSGEPQRSGLDEPFVVRNGALQQGELPGVAPDDAGAEGPLRITSLETSNRVIATAQGGKVFLGRTTPDAYAVGLRMTDVGSGWWMVPVGAGDPSYGGELTWQLTADFGGSVAPGIHRLRFAAIDGNGRGGPQRDVSVCVLPEVPDNLHACDATLAPPDTVITLAWDADVDLDLAVTTPDGKTVDARHPTSAAVDGSSVPTARLNDPSTGTLDRNSNAACVIDRIRRESVVWQGAPSPGVYRAYVNLFDACGRAGVRYRVSVWRRGANNAQTEVLRRDGALTSLAANGGATRGTFVAEVDLTPTEPRP